MQSLLTPFRSLLVISILLAGCAGKSEGPPRDTVASAPAIEENHAGHDLEPAHDHDHGAATVHDSGVAPVPGSASGTTSAPVKGVTYRFRGTAQMVDPGTKMAVVDHEKIGDYMQAQTTQFAVANADVLKTVPLGNQATFTIIVTEGNAVIVAVDRID